MGPRRHGISWEKRGPWVRRFCQCQPRAWRSGTVPLHPALGWASSPSSWGWNILLYKMGSLITFGTFNNSLHSKFMQIWVVPTPTSHVSLKEGKNQEPLGQKDLRGCLAISRRAKPISILNPEPGVGWAHLFGLPWTYRTSKEKPSYSVLGC